MNLSKHASILALAIAVIFSTPDQGVSQDVSFLPVERNPDYDAAVQFRNIQSELLYVNRLSGELPLDNMPIPPSQNDEEGKRIFGSSGMYDNASRVLLALLLGLLVFVALRYGKRARDGFSSTSRTKNPRERRRKRTDEQTSAKRARTQELIARLLDMEDREAAFVELVQIVLEAAAEQNELRLGRSETARDFLQRLPRGWSYLADIRRIVIAEELVQFGGRPLIARTFEDCLLRATPILDGAQA